MSGRISWTFREVDNVGSTQIVASRLVKEGARARGVVIASEQSVGRGRMRRIWQSPRGGLYMSLVLRPKRASGLQLLPLIGALAVAEDERIREIAQGGIANLFS